jgi:hypothetical protein
MKAITNIITFSLHLIFREDFCWMNVFRSTLKIWVGFVFFSCANLFPSTIFGQAASSNYSTQSGALGTTYSWRDCSSGTTIITGDDAQGSFSWPFTFSFYDNTYTTANSLSVATNGFIRLDGTANTDYNAASSYTLSSGSTELGQIIATSVYDSYVGRTGSSWVKYLVEGSAPNRVLTVEFDDIEIDYNAGRYADVQVSFYETSNKVVLKLGADNIAVAGADMGIHSGVSGYFDKWQEVASGTNNAWIEYTPNSIPTPPTGPAASWNYGTQTGTLGSAYSWISTSTPNIVAGDDAQATISWPFNFNFYDNSYTTADNLSLSTNGFIRLDGDAGTNYSAASAYTLSSGSTELGQIIAMGVYDAKVGDGGGWVRSSVTMTAPYRIFTIEYNNLEINYGAGRYADIQVSFYETLNKIVLKFGPTDNVNQAGADMGIHSGVSGYFNKWQEVASGTNNTYIEYTPPYIEVNATTGASLAFYPTLKSAFDKINDGTHRGNITIKIKNNTTETAPATLNASGAGSANYASVKIYPTVSGISINGDLATTLIDLNGADNVTIDGRVNATGSTADMVIVNTSTTANSTIRFINDATNNTIKYCNIKGSETQATGGVVFFSTTTGSTGNDANTIDNNNITSSSDANRPINAVYSLGTAGKDNSENTISNNKIYDFLNRANASNGIYLFTANTGWSILGNSFYETTSFASTAAVAYNAVLISNPSGNGFEITGNYIGGKTALCGGGAWTKTNSANNAFAAINLSVGTTSSSSVQNNTIQNISWGNSGSSPWVGINILAGNVNIGTATGNIIGNTSGTASIVVTNGATGNALSGIKVASTGNVNVQNNVVAGIKTATSTATNGFHLLGIEKTNVAGDITVANNTIGNTSTSNSLLAESASTGNFQTVYGIRSQGTGVTAISNNIVSNITNAVTGTNNSSRTVGIETAFGSNSIVNNVITNVSTASAQTGSNVNAAAAGISQLSSTGGTSQSVVKNKVSLIRNTHASARTDIYGIFMQCPTSGTHEVLQNFVQGFSFSSSNIGSIFNGIMLYSGLVTCANNVISVGAASLGYGIYGIWDNGGASNNTKVYFNTAYIGGLVSSGASTATAGLYSFANTSTRDYRNNILVNARTGGTANSNYSIYVAGTTGLTINYNDYVFPAGSILGKTGATNRADLPAWKTGTGQDANSLNTSPGFASAGGTNAEDYIPSALLLGVNSTGITVDYNDVTRLSTPQMGAFVSAGVHVWTGATSTDFATPSNWAGGIVPSDGEDIVFAASPARDCVLDKARVIRSINNWQGTYRFALNGKTLTLTGGLTLTNGAKVDASAAGSVLILAGTVAQTLPVGAFVANTIAGFTLNNSFGFSLPESLTISEALTLSNGSLLIAANTLTINGSITKTLGTLTGGGSSNIVIGGSGASTALPSVTINNLTINRNNGISLSGNVSVGGTLNLTAGTLTVGTNTLTIAGNSPTVASGNINAGNASASLVFANSSAITLPASVFSGAINNLTINGGGVTAKSNMSVNGILNLQSANPSSIKGALDLNSYTLNMGVSATTTGIGDVTGTIRRQHTFIGNVPYSFGNQYTTLSFINTGTKPGWISCKVSLGIDPDWRSTAVKRVYSFAKDAGDDRVNIRLHYLDSELDPTETDESKLVLWDHHNLPTPNFKSEPHGKSNNDEVNNWVEISGMSIGYAAPSAIHTDKEWGFSYSDVTRIIWTGSENNGDWSSAGNWNGGVPTSADDVLIPSGLSTTYPNNNSLSGTVPAVAQTIEIEAGASVTVDTYDITISGSSGAWINNGTFNAGTGKVLFNHGVPAGIVTVAGTTNFYNIEVAANTTMQPVAGCILRIEGAGTAYPSSLVDFSTINNTVEWNGTNQTIVNPIGIGGNSGFYNLIISGSGTKTMPATAMSVINNFSISGTASATCNSALTIGGSLNISNGATFATGTFSHSVGGNFDNSGTFISSAGQTITLNGTSAQTITGTAGTNFERLNIDNSAGVTLFANVVVNELLTLTSGNLNTDATTLTINGDIAKNAGFLNVNTLSSLTFGGTSALTIANNLFTTSPDINNLTINRTGGVTLGTDITVNGILDLQSANPTAFKGGLDMGSNTLTMGASATTDGIGDVTGIIKRTTVLPNVEYTFGNKFSSVTFPNIGTLPTQLALKVSIGTVPTWKTDGIKRVYDISQIGGSGTKAVIKSHYLDSELNGNNESNLSFFGYIIPTSTLLDRGLTQLNTTENWITLNNADFGNLPSAFGVIEHGFGVSTSEVITWDGTESTDWFDRYNWTPAFAPSITKVAIIPDAASTPNDPLITANSTSIVKTLSIQTGGILNAGANSQLTINGSSGAWSNTGTFNAGTGKVIFNHGVPSDIVTVSGNTDFYNIEVGANTTMQPVAGNVLSIAGVGSADVTSVVDFSTTNNTVEWKGANQFIVNPSGISGNSGYYNLVLSGSGAKTIQNTAMIIQGDFTVAGTTTATANAAISVNGNSIIESGATFITGNFSHVLKGNFQNDGTLTASPGGSISFSGNVQQTISGTSTTNFNTLNIDNAAGVIHTSLVYVNSNLLLSNGSFTVGNTALGINGPVTKTSGYLSVSNLSSLSFGGSSALILENNLFDSAPTLNNLSINRTGGVTLGNQGFTVNGILNLVSGTFTVGANTLTLAGSSPTRTNGTINAGNASATLVFANALPVTLPGSIFSGNINNLTINGAGGVTSGTDITMNKVLNLQSANPTSFKGSLDMGSFTLNMGANATTVGAGDVTGIVRREHTFTDGIEYTFGNQYTNLNFLGVTGGTKPTWVSCKISIGAAPSWRTEAINRYYSFAQSGGNDRMIVKLHYLDSELHGTETDETELVFWDAYDPALAPNNFVNTFPRNHNGTDAANNWIQLTGPAINYLATSSTLDVKQWGLSYTNVSVHKWIGLGSVSYPGDWSLPGHWEGGVPNEGDDVLIPATLPIGNSGYPYRNLLPVISPAMAKSVEIEVGANLTSNGYDITVSGFGDAWINNGTFTPGSGTVIFNHGDENELVNLNGATNFNNLTVSSKTFLQAASGSTTNIAGTFNAEIDSKLDFTTNANTVEYTGSAVQNVANQPAEPTAGYYNLVFSGSGTKTLSADELKIYGNLATNAAVSASGNTLSINGSAPQIIAGTVTPTLNNLTISNTASPVTSSVNLACSGNFANSGEFDMTSASLAVAGTVTNTGTVKTASVSALPLPQGKTWGGTVQYYNSSGNQTAVGGTFNNLTFSNASGTQTASGDIAVDGTLTTTSGGLLNMGTNQLLGTLSTISNGGTIQTQNTSAAPIPAGKTWGGTIQYNSLAGGQTVVGGIYNSLILNNTSGTQTAIGDITATTFNTTAGGMINMGMNVLAATNLLHAGILRTQNSSTTPFTAGLTWGGTVVFDGSVGQTLPAPASVFNNLTIGNPAGVTAAANQTINGILNLGVANPDATHGSLDMATYTLNLGANSTTIGIGDVTGIIARAHTFVENTSYSFGNENQIIIFPVVAGQTLPSSIIVKISLIAVAPGWLVNGTKRKYQMMQTGADAAHPTKALFRCNYLDTELASGVNESLLSYWFTLDGVMGIDLGWSNFNISENWITLSNVRISDFPTSFGAAEINIAPTLSETRTWNGSIDTDWNNSSNWTPSGVPTPALGIVIPDATTTVADPELPNGALGKFIILESGSILNTISGSSLTLSGVGDVWSAENNSIFNGGTNSTVIFSGNNAVGDVSISGSTTFNNLTISSGTLLRPGVNAYMGISGVLTNSGVFAAATNHNTIEFKQNASFALPNPNGSTPGYHSLIISGTGTKTLPASLYIWHDFTNNGTVDAGTGTVTMGTVGVLEGVSTNIGGSSSTTFYNLVNNNVSAPLTTTANISIGGALTINGNTTLQPGATNTIGGTGTLTGSGTAKVTGLGAINSFCTQYPIATKTLTNLTVDYNGAGDQTVCAENYGNLLISPNGTRTVTLASSGIIGVSGVFDPDKTLTDYIVTGSTMNSNGTGSQIVPAFNYYNVLVSGDRGGGTITLANDTIGIAGHSTVSATNANFVITNNTIDINGSGDQSIDPFTFWNVRFSGGGSKTTSGNLTVVGSFKVEPGVTLDMSSSILDGTFNGGIINNGTIKTANTSISPIPVGKNWGGTIEYTGSTAQSVVGGTFNNLKMSGAGGGTAMADITVNGVLNLNHSNPSATQGILHTDTYTLNMGESATTIGTGDVTGVVKRQHNFENGIEYSFGNQFTTFNFLGISGSTKPTWLSCKIEIGAAPSWRSVAVKRFYSFAQSGGDDRVITKLHYLDSELNSGETDESRLMFWGAYPGPTYENSMPRGKSSFSETNNWITLSGMALNMLATGSLDFRQWGLSYTNVDHITWTGTGPAAYSGDWSLPGNWVGGVPGANDDVLIPSGLTTAYPYRNLLSALTPANVKTLEIEAGASINANDFNITVSGDANAWLNNGTFVAGTGTVIFNNGNTSNAATISGATNFYNLTVSGNTKIQPVVGSFIGIGGTLSAGSGSILDFSANDNTINYNGNNSQTILNPNGTIPGYYNLILSSSGAKTFPASTLNILGDLTINADLITSGNTTVMSGSALQTISGSNTTEFNHLTIDNANVVSLNMDQLTKILGTLQINAGKKMEIAADNKLTVTGSIVNNGGNNGLTLISDLTGSASLIHSTNGVAATVERYIGGAAENWHFLSSPVSNQTIAGSPFLPAGTYGNGTGYDLYVWDEPTPCWVYHLNTTVVPNWPAVHPQANFVPGRGYLYSVQAVNATNDFAGNLNNGNVSYGLTVDCTSDLTLQGFNLVGNPYPSSIDWKESKGWTRDILVSSGGGNDMWIWNPEAENYGVYNSADASGVGTNAVTRYIPSMQGFFVRAQSAGNLETTNDVRLHDATTLWKSAQIETNRFIAVVHSETDQTFDEVRLLFGYPENLAGAAKLFSPVTTAPSLYLPEGKANYTVRYLTDTIANPHVPLMFKAGIDGYYTINFDFDTYDFDIAILEDRLTGRFTDLTLAPDYRFKASIKDNENRFILHFGAISTNANMELPANIYINGGELVIDLTFVDDLTDVRVVDVLGRTILQNNFNGNSIQKLNLNVRSQIVIVYAKTSKAMVSRKVFVH